MDEEDKEQLWTDANEIAAEQDPDDIEDRITDLHGELAAHKVALLVHRETERIDATEDWIDDLDRSGSSDETTGDDE